MWQKIFRQRHALRKNWIQLLMAGFAALMMTETLQAETKTDFRPGREFVGFSDFETFSRQPGARSNEFILTSPLISTRIRWNELIASWNVKSREIEYLRIEAKATIEGRDTSYYTLGFWSLDSTRHPRESVKGQGDGDGDVQTDVLVLKNPASAAQMRLTVGLTSPSATNALDFLGLSFAAVPKSASSGSPETAQDREASPSQKSAVWGTTLPVPERSQMVYPGGSVWCSPTCTSMILAFWGTKLGRSDLDVSVPDVAAAVYDRNWPGTGNWPFNTAYAGSFSGMRAYVSRLGDVSELEEWIAAGIPVALSVSYGELKGAKKGPDGHLVVLTGFTDTGEPVINDPGTTENVRKVFPRENLVRAWSYSQNTVYLIYPVGYKTPANHFHHWHGGE